MGDELKDLVIENMREEDLEEVLMIEKESFSDPWRREFFLKDISNQFSFPAVVRVGKKLVGYTCVWKIEDEIQIANIAIARDYRRKGIARRVLEWIVEQGLKDNFKYITLDVRESNIAALRLYQRHGFEEICRRKNYYHNPTEDALVMEKKL